MMAPSSFVDPGSASISKNRLIRVGVTPVTIWRTMLAALPIVADAVAFMLSVAFSVWIGIRPRTMLPKRDCSVPSCEVNIEPRLVAMFTISMIVRAVPVVTNAPRDAVFTQIDSQTEKNTALGFISAIVADGVFTMREEERLPLTV